MNNFRTTQCGNTVFAIGQLFDPNDLVDPRTLIGQPEKMTSHMFDGLGMVRSANDEARDRPVAE